jgi:hypothetical protein
MYKYEHCTKVIQIGLEDLNVFLVILITQLALAPAGSASLDLTNCGSKVFRKICICSEHVQIFLAVTP